MTSAPARTPAETSPSPTYAAIRRPRRPRFRFLSTARCIAFSVGWPTAALRLLSLLMSSGSSDYRGRQTSTAAGAAGGSALQSRKPRCLEALEPGRVRRHPVSDGLDRGLGAWSADGPTELLAVSVTAPRDPAPSSTTTSPFTTRTAGCPPHRIGSSAPRQPGCRLPRRHPVRRDDPAGPGAACTAILRRGRLRRRGQGSPPPGGRRRRSDAGVYPPAAVREHCLENTGANEMRVLGVFHPRAIPPLGRPSQLRAGGPGQHRTGGIRYEVEVTLLHAGFGARNRGRGLQGHDRPGRSARRRRRSAAARRARSA